MRKHKHLEVRYSLQSVESLCHSSFAWRRIRLTHCTLTKRSIWSCISLSWSCWQRWCCPYVADFASWNLSVGLLFFLLSHPTDSNLFSNDDLPQETPAHCCHIHYREPTSARGTWRSEGWVHWGRAESPPPVPLTLRTALTDVLSVAAMLASLSSMLYALLRSFPTLWHVGLCDTCSEDLGRLQFW